MAGIDRFTKDEFELALPVHKKTGDALWYPIGLVEEEFVYAVPVTKTNKRIVIRSSVDHTERAAMCGHDSIRLWLEYQYQGEWRPLKKLDRWTTRVPGWDRRLKDKIRELWKLALADSKKRNNGHRANVPMHYKDIEAELERLQERVAFASDPDLGSPEMLVEAKRELEEFVRASVARDDTLDKVLCPACSSTMKLRNGRHGEFYGCSQYPNCTKTLSVKAAEDQIAKRKAAYDKVTSSARPYEVGCAGGNSYHGSGETCVYCGGSYFEKPREYVPSHYQSAVFDFVSNGKGNAVVEAVAGSGKTTTIVEALKLTAPGDSVLFCAFNKHIQRELAKRAPDHVQVSTIHSIGLRTLGEGLSHKPNVDSSKLYSIVKEILPHEMEAPLRAPLMKLVALCKRTLTDPVDTVAVEAVADHYGVELNGDADPLIALVPKVMRLCMERLATIDFDDMIWLPIVLNLRFRTFKWVFVDECQDLSPVQLEIVKRSVAGTGRVVAVGDRRQSIYGFTGADTRAVPRLIEELEATTLPLSITYRCPKRVVALAAEIVPQIEAADWAADGVIEDVSYQTMIGQLNDEDLVLCRVNAPLVKACYALILKGTKATIRGRDIGKGLLNFIDRLKPVDVFDLVDKVREYRRVETIKLEKAGKESRIETMQDRCDTLVALCEGVSDLTDLRYRISSIFDDNTQDGVILSSVHRAKGDEANTVYILKPELMPHPLATKEWQLEQEYNLKYVAYTRTKHTLYFVRG